MPRTAGPAASICGRRRADAEAFYTGPWLEGIRERYGMDPQIKYFETACVTDNAVEAVLLPPRRNRHMTRIASIATYPVSVPRPAAGMDRAGGKPGVVGHPDRGQDR